MGGTLCKVRRLCVYKKEETLTGRFISLIIVVINASIRVALVVGPLQPPFGTEKPLLGAEKWLCIDNRNKFILSSSHE
jgi:hypothetical protein